MADLQEIYSVNLLSESIQEILLSESTQEIYSVNLLSELTEEIYALCPLHPLCPLHTVNLLSDFTQ